MLKHFYSPSQLCDDLGLDAWRTTALSLAVMAGKTEVREAAFEYLTNIEDSLRSLLECIAENPATIVALTGEPQAGVFSGVVNWLISLASYFSYRTDTDPDFDPLEKFLSQNATSNVLAEFLHKLVEVETVKELYDLLDHEFMTFKHEVERSFSMLPSVPTTVHHD